MPPPAGHGPGIPWADRFSYCQRAVVPSPEQLERLAGAGAYWQPACVMPLGQIYWVLAVQCVGFMALAIYLDAVLPDPNGVVLPPWFFLLPSYWRSSSGVGRIAEAKQAVVVTVGLHPASQDFSQLPYCYLHHTLAAAACQSAGVHCSAGRAQRGGLRADSGSRGGSGGAQDAAALRGLPEAQRLERRRPACPAAAERGGGSGSEAPGAAGWRWQQRQDS